MPKKNKIKKEIKVENVNVEAVDEEFIEADDFYVEDGDGAESYDCDMNEDVTEERPDDSVEPAESDEAKPTDVNDPDVKKIKKEKKIKEPKTPKAPKEEKNIDETDDFSVVRLAVTLTMICVSVALILTVVNNITKDIIAENKVKETEAAIMSVFPECDSASEYVTDGGDAVYIAVKNAAIIGYCVNAVGSGYGGGVETLIALDTDGRVSGIKIVSMSETPGVGTNVKSESFLKQFIGFDRKVTLGEDVDGISGATFSSKAIEEAVNYAISLEVDLDDAANAIGVVYIGEEGKVSDKVDANIDNGDEEIEIGEAGEEGDIPETEPETETELTVETEEQTVIETQPIGYLNETESETDPPMVIEPYIPPAPETETESETEPVPETEPETETEPIIETETESETVGHIEWDPSWEDETESETEIESETELVLETEPETETETIIETETESETVGHVEWDPSWEDETESESEIESETETSEKDEAESETSDKDDTDSSLRPTSGSGRTPGGGLG